MAVSMTEAQFLKAFRMAAPKFSWTCENDGIRTTAWDCPIEAVAKHRRGRSYDTVYDAADKLGLDHVVTERIISAADNPTRSLSAGKRAIRSVFLKAVQASAAKKTK